MKTKARRTPGPWTATEDRPVWKENKHLTYQLEGLAGKKWWATLEIQEDYKDEAEANIALLISAPDLLEAAKVMIEALELTQAELSVPKEAYALIAAIARAEGKEVA